MAEPSGPQIHVDAALTDFSVAHFMADDAFVARKAFPSVPVQKQTDRYHVWTRGDLLRTEAQRRAPGTRVRLRDFGVSDAGYYVEVVAVGHASSEQDQANSDASVALEQGIVQGLVQDIKIAEEVKFASVAFGTSPSTQNFVIGTLIAFTTGGERNVGSVLWTPVPFRAALRDITSTGNT